MEQLDLFGDWHRPKALKSRADMKVKDQFRKKYGYADEGYCGSCALIRKVGDKHKCIMMGITEMDETSISPFDAACMQYK